MEHNLHIKPDLINSCYKTVMKKIQKLYLVMIPIKISLMKIRISIINKMLVNLMIRLNIEQYFIKMIKKTITILKTGMVTK